MLPNFFKTAFHFLGVLPQNNHKKLKTKVKKWKCFLVIRIIARQRNEFGLMLLYIIAIIGRIAITNVNKLKIVFSKWEFLKQQVARCNPTFVARQVGGIKYLFLKY